MVKEMNSFGKTPKTESESEELKKQQNRQKALAAITTVDPLSDKAFKKFIESDYWFIQLTEAILGRSLSEEHVVSIQGENALSINGKLTRMDGFKSTNSEVINIESQSEARDFPYKRHLFYGAIAYACTLQESQPYEVLKPATSIVLYKDRGKAAILEGARMQGTLMHGPEEQSLLTLIAVNVKKWQDASNSTLKQLLAIMSNGTYSKENATAFQGIDTSSETFIKMNKAVTRASAIVRYEDSKERGDTEMESILKGFLSEDERRELEAKVAQEKAKAAQEKAEKEKAIIALLKMGMSEDNIIKTLNISPERLQQIKKEANL